MAGATAPGMRTSTSPGGNSPGLAATSRASRCAGAVHEGFGADALDRLHGEAERNAAGDGLVRDHEILGANSQDAGFAGGGPAVAGELRLDLVCRSGIRFIGGAPMNDATKVVAGFW